MHKMRGRGNMQSLNIAC